MSFPSATIPLKPFQVNTPQSALDDLKTLLRLSPLGPETYENGTGATKDERDFGVTMKWMKETKAAWQEYDWRKSEAKLNELPMFTAEVREKVPDAEGETHTIHFVGIYNPDPKAIPLLLLHGWPGCFLEFTHLIPHLTKAGSPPVHIIVPSLPGYAYSSAPPLDRDFTLVDTAKLMDSLMVGLGFENGYVAQGGDLGSYISRLLGSSFDSCKAVHLNFTKVASAPPDIPENELPVTDEEKIGLDRSKTFVENGSAYAQMHATRPATIGFCLASSPVALMAWVGEKILGWTDESPDNSVILPWLTLYWITSTYPTSIWAYRGAAGRAMSAFIKDPDAVATVRHGDTPKGTFISKPLGFSWFPKELTPIPKSWLEKSGDLVHFSAHDKGGHFAATEQPELLAKDIFDFLAVAWK